MTAANQNGRPGAPKPPKKLVPRRAPKQEALAPVVATVSAPADHASAAPPVVPAKVPASVVQPETASTKVRPPRKPSAVDATVARHQKVLAEVLVEAQAINYAQPLLLQPAGKTEKSAKPAKVKAAKPAKDKRPELVRDSFAMPEREYARLGELKKRLHGLGRDVKKSELLRGGIAVLNALNDIELQAIMARVERIKTGRPAK